MRKRMRELLKDTRKSNQAFIQHMNTLRRYRFECMGASWYRYTERQKAFALSLVDALGVRQTAKVLCVPRRTIQRWCRQYSKPVSRYPAWLYEWARNRRYSRKLYQ